MPPSLKNEPCVNQWTGGWQRSGDINMCKSFGGGDRLFAAAASAIMHTEIWWWQLRSSAAASAIIWEIWWWRQLCLSAAASAIIREIWWWQQLRLPAAASAIGRNRTGNLVVAAIDCHYYSGA